ncbi:hypothetical protein F4819DRAFT_82442 [Hypoxylon fuscum]|nr:hypothetical protein F4819DRAFT_82442 [Hypoxylon fuscum]
MTRHGQDFPNPRFTVPKDRPNIHTHNPPHVRMEWQDSQDSNPTKVYYEKGKHPFLGISLQDDTIKTKNSYQPRFTAPGSPKCDEDDTLPKAKSLPFPEQIHRALKETVDSVGCPGIDNPLSAKETVDYSYLMPDTPPDLREADTSKAFYGGHEIPQDISESYNITKEDGFKDPFRNPVLIPHISPPVFVYPHSSSNISSVYHNRFAEIVNIFRQNTLEDTRLSSRVKHVDYGLKLCGSSAETAHPSIIVFCHPQDFKPLKSLLDQKHLKAQYCIQKGTPKSLLHSLSTREVKTEPYKPLFKLYIWRAQRPRTLLANHKVRVDVGFDAEAGSKCPSPNEPLLTLCGAPVYKVPEVQQISTLGCVLRVGSALYGLTASHALRQPTTPKKHLQIMTAVHHTNEYSIGSFDDTCSLPDMGYDSLEFDDDVVYEDLTEDEDHEYFLDEDETQYSINPEGLLKETNPPKIATVALCPILGRTTFDDHEFDLDWALIRLDQPKQWRPNAFFYPSGASLATVIPPVPAALPRHETEVFVILSSRAIKRGVLQSSKAFLGGINGDQPSQVWSVILIEPQGLTKGDSGALVIDAQTFAIYGHVIGSNPLGEIYISPFVETLEQIKVHFDERNVSLPHPILSLVYIAKSYFDAGKFLEAETSLEFLLQEMQSTTPDPILLQDSWSTFDKLDKNIHLSIEKSGVTSKTFLVLLQKIIAEFRALWCKIMNSQKSTQVEIPLSRHDTDPKILADDSAIIDEDDIPPLVPFNSIVETVSSTPQLRFSSRSRSTPNIQDLNSLNIREHLIDAPKLQAGRTRRVS